MTQRLAWELETRKSVEIEVVTKIIKRRTGEKRPISFDSTDEHYIETAVGQRYCDDRLRLGDKVVGRSAHFGNGSRFANVTYYDQDTSLQKVVEYRRSYWKEETGSRKEIPGPIRFLYVGHEPLNKSLPKAEYLGKGKVIDRECEVFLFAKVPWLVPQDQVYSLDAATGIPLKVESFQDRSAREQNQPMWVWTAESLDKVKGHYVTMKASQISYGADHEPQLIWEQSVESVAFNRDYPATTFWPTPDPGVTLMDSTKGTITEAPGVKKAPPAAKSGTASTTTPAQAIPPSDWTSYTSPVMLGLGVAILIGAVLIWWRRRLADD